MVTSHDDRRFASQLVLPERQVGPGFLLLHDIFGLGEYLMRRAQQLADIGYLVMAPDLYWRIEPDLNFPHTDRGLAQAVKVRAKLDPDAAVGDALAAFRLLGELPESKNGSGVFGMGTGSDVAFMVAALADPVATVCYYGTNLDRQLEWADRIRCPMIFHFGSDDPLVPLEKREAVRQAFSGRSDVEIQVHQHAQHGFDNSALPMFYREEAAQQAWGQTVDFLRRTFPAMP